MHTHIYPHQSCFPTIAIYVYMCYYFAEIYGKQAGWFPISWELAMPLGHFVQPLQWLPTKFCLLFHTSVVVFWKVYKETFALCLERPYSHCINNYILCISIIIVCNIVSVYTMYVHRSGMYYTFQCDMSYLEFFKCTY